MSEIESIKHTKATRAHIPSREEAGFEDGNPTVQGKQTATYPVNPVVHRGQDPELFWLNKYGNDDREEQLKVDIRSLYRHEHISPEMLINRLYTAKTEESAQRSLFDTNELFGNALEVDELEKPATYYDHHDGWSNRLIQGDSLLVMTSLLEREGMAGKVQTIYFDPPYGIKYGGNWQMKLNDREVKDGNDEHLSGEPEQIKAFRDTWELGIHSYLSYLRDRLLVAKEMLTESGSCFVQISDENVHLVRNIMDEVFGSENFVSMISFTKTGSLAAGTIACVCDYALYYARQIESLKFRPLYVSKDDLGISNSYSWIEDSHGTRRSLTAAEKKNRDLLPDNVRFYQPTSLISSGASDTGGLAVEFSGKVYSPPSNSHWKTTQLGIKRLIELNRIVSTTNSLRFVRYLEDFPVAPLSNAWTGLGAGSFTEEQRYVVQTSVRAIQRCILMSTDPGDLVLDPTCGSGTTAYVAEQWGRRWLTIDTSRIALNIAKSRMLTAIFPYYVLYDEKSVGANGVRPGVPGKDAGIGGKGASLAPLQNQNIDIRNGFVYKTVPHITLKSLANDEPADTETLFDQPEEDKKRLRVAGPFTVETLQSFEPVSPESLNVQDAEGAERFEERIFDHLKSAGVKNGDKNEHAVFIRVERLNSPWLHAEGFYTSATSEKKAYLHIGPKFGTVSKQAVNEAVKECRTRGDADWLIILGFSFESNITNENVTTRLGGFEVTKVRMHDDLMQNGLLKKDKKAASFVTIGEPDVVLLKDATKFVRVEIRGLDIYDPIKDLVKPRDIHDIAYWMVDDDYDGNNFIVKQLFFCGGDKDEFKKWQKGLSDFAKQRTKAKAEKTLKIEIDDEAFDRLYGHISHPIEILKSGQKIAVRVISQFGEESTKVMVG